MSGYEGAGKEAAQTSTNLVVEADGGQHLVNVRNDRVRTEYPESSGYRVMRFWNHDILRDTQVVMGCIHRFLIELPDSE